MTGDEGRTVVVAVLTFERTDELNTVLPRLLEQARAVSSVDASVLVVDNNPDGGAREAVEAFGAPDLEYVHEPRAGIAAARNRALAAAAHSDALVFIDDDERPSPDWLRLLVHTWIATGAGGVVGPVISEFDPPLDPWIEAGGFFRRRRLATGTVVDVAATNNLLVDMAVLRRIGLRFDEAFGLTGGSDTVFTRSLTALGQRLVWCDEAWVTDVVPPSRATRQWVLRRAFRLGNSESRTRLALASGSMARVRVRATMCAGGAVRLGAGLTRLVVGRMSRSVRHEARGTRTAVRGLGMLTGVGGHHYAEYKRRGS